MSKYINIKWVDEENIPWALSLSAWEDLRCACLYLGSDGHWAQPVVLGLLLLSTVLWPSEERVGRLEEPKGRACFPPRAGATCRWRGVGSWELVSCLWAASSIIQLSDRGEWWWGCRKDLPLLRHARWRGSLEFQSGARLVAQLKAWASFANKIHRRLSPWKCRIALGKEDKSQRTKADLFFLLWVSEDGVGQDKKAVTCWEVSARAGDRRLVLPGVQCFVAA